MTMNYDHLANASYSVWCEYADPGMTMTEKEWAKMTTNERIEYLFKCFGEEDDDDFDNEW
jgi:hypothetical protein